MSQFRPHIFFDDQLCHLDSTKAFGPSVHIPFGVAIQAQIELEINERDGLTPMSLNELFSIL